jgi:hypothetical protein
MYRGVRITAEHKNTASSNPFDSWIAACDPWNQVRRDERRTVTTIASKNNKNKKNLHQNE